MVILQVLDCYKWLSDSYMVDFFVENNWQKLPKSWQEYFKDFSDVHVTSFISSILNPRCSKWSDLSSPPPLSLISLKTLVFRVSIPFYQPVTFSQLHSIFDNIHPGSDFTDIQKELNSKQRLKIKDKKSHEIGRIVDLVNVLLQFNDKKDCPINEIVDIGAGLGHLSRILSLLVRKTVKTIEGDHQMVQRSQTIDVKVSGGSVKMPDRIATFITSEAEIAETRDSLLIGVHTCGDLAPTIIRHFKNNVSARSLIHFGCCYHKMNGGIDKPFRDEAKLTLRLEENGFPLSQKYKVVNISYAARELACFSHAQFTKNIVEVDSNFFVNSHRAALEHLIVELGNPTWRHKRMVGVKDGFRMNFWDYARSTAIHHQDITKLINQSEKNKEVAIMIEQLLKTSHTQVPIFYALRLLIAPLIETLILRDRMQYLHENGIFTRLIPLFDHKISPRNVALVAIK